MCFCCRTKLIHDQNQTTPQYKGLVHGVRTIVKDEGIGGIYRGVTSVIARQGANSAVRLTAYGILKERVVGRYAAAGTTGNIPWYVTFANGINIYSGLFSKTKNPTLVTYTLFLGAVAGIITVYATMPLDVVKTKMQSLNAKTLYRNSFHCFYKTFTEEGVFSLWKCATPRLGRLIVRTKIKNTV